MPSSNERLRLEGVDNWLGYLGTLWLPFFLAEGAKDGAVKRG